MFLVREWKAPPWATFCCGMGGGQKPLGLGLLLPLDREQEDTELCDVPAGVKHVEQDSGLPPSLCWPSPLAIAFFYFALFCFCP